MRYDWEPAPPVHAGTALYFPAISRGYEELMFPEQAKASHEEAMWEAKRIAARRNVPWWRRFFSSRADAAG